MVNLPGKPSAFALHDRLDLLERSHVISARARAATERATPVIEDFIGTGLDDEAGGQFVTHLAVALTRLDRREPAPELPTVVAAEIVDRHEEWAVARSLAGEWERHLGQPLPDAELAYVVVHLAVLRERGRLLT